MFVIGDEWIEEEEVERNTRFHKNKQLLKGKHYKVFENDILARLKKSGYEITGGFFSITSKSGASLSSNIPVSSMFVSQNLLGLATKTYRNFLFGEMPILSTEDDGQNKWLQDFIEGQELYQKCLTGCNMQSALGWSAFRSRINDEGKVILEKVDNEYIYFNENEKNKGEIESIDIRYLIDIKDSDNKTLFVERYYKGSIERASYIVKGNKIIGYKELDEGVLGYEETGLDDFAITIVHNELTDCMEGDSDYNESAVNLQKEIDIRLTQTAMSLDKTQNPMVQVPRSLSRVDPVTHEEYVDIIGKAIFADEDDKEVKYVEYDGNYEIVENIIINRSKSLLGELSIVYALIDTENLGNASGTALKVKLIPTLQIINMKKNQWEIAIRKMINNAYKLETGSDLKKISFKWYDGIPIDRREEAEISKIRTAGKATQSVQSSIMEQDGKSEDEALLEVAKINEEEKLIAEAQTVIPQY